MDVGKLIRADMMDMIPRNEIQGLFDDEHALSSETGLRCRVNMKCEVS